MYQHSVDPDQLGKLDPDAQREVMERWFRERFEDPAERTPYESREGGYQWIWGGPYDAEEQLRIEFEGVVPDKVIEELAGELSGECPEWAPVPSQDDYDHSLFEVVTANANRRATLAEALETIRRLQLLQSEGDLEAALNRMLFANIIAALETYLSDSFLNRVLANDDELREFVESTPDFKKRTVVYSEIFKAVGEARDEVKRYLLDVVWHNLAKVQAMYLATLKVDMRAHLAPVAKAIPKRHDIVHRNGKDRDGKPIEVSAEDVQALIDAVATLADHIENELQPWF